MTNFCPKKWSWLLKKLEQRLFMREFLNQFLTEKQNGCRQSGSLWEELDRREFTVLVKSRAVIDI